MQCTPFSCEPVIRPTVGHPINKKVFSVIFAFQNIVKVTLKSFFDLFDCFLGILCWMISLKNVVISVSSLLKEIFKLGSAVNSINRCFDPMARKSKQKLRAKNYQTVKGRRARRVKMSRTLRAKLELFDRKRPHPSRGGGVLFVFDRIKSGRQVLQLVYPP